MTVLGYPAGMLYCRYRFPIITIISKTRTDITLFVPMKKTSIKTNEMGLQ